MNEWCEQLHNYHYQFLCALNADVFVHSLKVQYRFSTRLVRVKEKIDIYVHVRVLCSCIYYKEITWI